MSSEVYANNDCIACKAGDGKVIASFPDVCLTPPPPPAGPIPVPYPDTSFSKDMQNGSKTVMIKGSEVMLKDQSFYKTSPLGDEAATNGQGANVITHVITGKTYFGAWSMDVKFEDANVDRNLDITTSNHASYPPGNATPNPNCDALATAKWEEKHGICACCKKKIHSRGAPESFSDFYKLDEKTPNGRLTKEAKRRRKLVDRAMNKTCTCPKVVPQKPCNVFRKLPQPNTGKKSKAKEQIDEKWDNHRATAQGRLGIGSETAVAAKLKAKLGRKPTQDELNYARKVNHVTPRFKGGCPTGPGNLVAQKDLCQKCQKLDDAFTEIHSKGYT